MTGETFSNSQNRNTFTIVGCGQSAENWKPYGHSIGVNDAFKWGKPLDSLLICNRPEQFNSTRIETILKTNPKNFYTHKNNWAELFPRYIKINIVSWYGVLNPGQVYCSDSSPFIAISLAFTLGAKQIVMYGCDFKNHHIFNDNNSSAKTEIANYIQLFSALKQKGCEVYLGEKGTAFDDLIPI